MDEQAAQAMLERFALLAKPRLLELLRLNAQHVYDPAPGNANSITVTPVGEVRLKLVRSIQPYGDITRLAVDDKVMGYVINPGLLPLAKAVSLDVRGRKLLVTRKLAAREDDPGQAVNVDGLGVRILMYFDPDGNQTKVIWECLYGVT